MDSPLWIYCVGISAQVFYTGRVFVQWYLSEKHGRVESPALYWILSIIGSMILFFYGWLRNDFSIIFGEYLSYYIYMWNIKAKGLYAKTPKIVPIIQVLLPVVVSIALFKDIPQFAQTFLKNDDVPLRLLILGTAGQFIYKMRFVYQWLYSVKKGQSLLPLSFWVIAIVGSLLIIIYGIIRHDWVLILGQFGIIASARNIMIGLSNKIKNVQKSN
ncbi:MAG: lipid-A-disaccharide synthase N-terminal domain-containing protein [Bacteroidales bacterium]|nr:lipid-A-disaccharide synthase N-terminal domain-containing protein [Bacteroidales bacterium]MCI5619839.1 lipid-A-disaccharide synthase N-terminal domain-containing protein [Rikenellaceae bacterium]